MLMYVHQPLSISACKSARWNSAANAWCSPGDKNLGLNFPSGHQLAGPQAGLCPQLQAPPFGYEVFFFHFPMGKLWVSKPSHKEKKKKLIPINELTGGSDVTIFLPRDQMRGKGSNAYEMPGICQELTLSPKMASELVLILLIPLMRRLQYKKNK